MIVRDDRPIGGQTRETRQYSSSGISGEEKLRMKQSRANEGDVSPPVFG
jgi:hypothetical protein